MPAMPFFETVQQTAHEKRLVIIWEALTPNDETRPFHFGTLVVNNPTMFSLSKAFQRDNAQGRPLPTGARQWAVSANVGDRIIYESVKAGLRVTLEIQGTTK